MSRPPTILFICSEPPAGSAAQRWSRLLPELQRQGSRTILLDLRRAAPPGEQLRDGDAAENIRVDTPLALLRVWRELTSAIAAADLVVSRGALAQIAGVLVTRRRGIPHLADVPPPPADRRPLLAQRLLVRLGAARTDGVVTTDETRLPALVELGYAPVRMRVLPTDGADGVAAGYEQALAEVQAHVVARGEAPQSPR